MNDQTHHEVISAFIDNEPFDANELGTALATPEGRELLLDLISLRHVVIADGTTESASRVPARMSWRALAAAAAIVLALGGGYVAGQRIANDAHPAASEKLPPTPTRVIELNDWQHSQGGR